MTRERLTIMQIREYVTHALARQNEIAAECENEGCSQDTKFAQQLGSATAYLEMLDDILNIYYEEDEKEEAAYEKSVLGEEV